MILLVKDRPHPTLMKERVRELDIVRGFALFGVLLVNLAMFHMTPSSIQAGIDPYHNFMALDSSLDRLSVLFVQVFGEGKFYTIFSFLFGLGFYIFMERAESKGMSAKKLFIKRAFFLFLFGVLHFSFVWFGDILHVYGLIGFLLLPFFKCKVKTIRNWIIGLLAGIMMIMSLLTMLNSLTPQLMTPEAYAELQANMLISAEESINVYQNGSFLDIVKYRLRVDSIMAFINLLFFPKILGMFLIGLYVGKKEIYKDIEGNMGLIKKTWKVGGIVGGITTIIYLLAFFEVLLLGPMLSLFAYTLFKEVTTVFLSFFYVTSIVLLYRTERFKKLLSPLGYMGQMALTNYLVQCIIASLIFYGHGLGMINRSSFAFGILLTFVIYILQVFYSKLWMQKFKYGPFEWMWRRLTYGKMI